MGNKKIWLYLAVFLLLVLPVTGCGTGTAADGARIESGVIDEQYSGVTNPQIPQKFKLSDQGQKGIEKSKDAAEPGSSGQSSADKTGGANEAKPKI